MDAEREVELLREAVTRAYDAAMPRAGPRPALRQKTNRKTKRMHTSEGVSSSFSGVQTVTTPVRCANQKGRPRIVKDDIELAEEAAIVKEWVAGSSGPATPMDVEREVKHLGEAMSRVCVVAMPRVGPTPSLRSVYWWSDEIARLRAICVASRRQYHRCRRWRRQDVDEADRRYALYREAGLAVRVAIEAAQREANERHLLDGDP